MTSTIELVDALVKLAVTHAKLPAGSAAAHEVDQAFSSARCTLLEHLLNHAEARGRLLIALQEAIQALDSEM